MWVKNGNIFHYNEINKKWESENTYWYLIPGDINKSFFPSEAISMEDFNIPLGANMTNALLCVTDEDWNMSFVNLAPLSSGTSTICGFESYDTIFTDPSKLVNIGHESPLSENCRIPSFFINRGILGVAPNSWGFIHNQNYKNFIIDIFNKFRTGEIDKDNNYAMPAIVINGIYQANISIRYNEPEDIYIRYNGVDKVIWSDYLEISTDSGWGGIKFWTYKGDLYIQAWAG